MLESRNIVAILLGGNLKEAHNKSLLAERCLITTAAVRLGGCGFCYAVSYANIIMVIGNGKFLWIALKILETAAAYRNE